MGSTADREARNALIVERRRAGESSSAIAKDLGLSLTVVSKVALGAGYRSRPGPGKRFDWDAIRAFYEAGHTKRATRERFGFSCGAWDQAVVRGDVKPRVRPDPYKFAHTTRQEVARRLAEGQQQAEIASELNLSKGTIAYHARNLDVAADQRFARRYDWDEIQRVYDTGRSAIECREEFGCSAASWHQAVKRGDLVPRPRKEPLAQLLTISDKRRARYHLKRRLIESGLKNDRCERCGLTQWRGEPISLELHHLNGDPYDNRLECLQILCPNCHSQTESFGRRNARRPAGTA